VYFKHNKSIHFFIASALQTLIFLLHHPNYYNITEIFYAKVSFDSQIVNTSLMDLDEVIAMGKLPAYKYLFSVYKDGSLSDPSTFMECKSPKVSG